MWSSRSGDPLIRELLQTGTAKHWKRRARRRRYDFRISHLFLEARNRLAKRRENASLVGGLLGGVVITGLTAVALIAISEGIAVALHQHHAGLSLRLDRVVADSRYAGFVTAGVGAQAAFLALFFTTVGVIASTAYAVVPDEIRQLFLQERGSRVYIANVVRALVFGIVLLAMPAIGFSPHGLTLVVFTVLTLFSVLSLGYLGRRLFNFFDLSSLAIPLPGNFRRAARLAEANKGRVPNEPQQRAAHQAAARTLGDVRQVVTHLVTRQGGERDALVDVLYRVLVMWGNYATVSKTRIPTDSQWFERTASHPNWLTLEHTRLQIAIDTRTGVQPELVPDPLWVERDLGQRIATLLQGLLTESDWPAALQFVDQVTGVIRVLAYHLQVEEALHLVQVIRTTLWPVVLGNTGETDRAIDDGGRQGWTDFRLAAVERVVLLVTSVWLGVADTARTIDAEKLRVAWSHAVADPTNPYGVQAPRSQLVVLEELAAGIALEERTEGKRITPDWWIHHYAARSVARDLHSAVETLMKEINGRVMPAVEESADDSQRTAMLIFEALELMHKLSSHLPTFESALQVLAGFRHPAACDDMWPDLTLPSQLPSQLEDRLLLRLAAVIDDLPADRHDRSGPDLFGQAYKRLFDASFQAILDGNQDLARTLFPRALAAAESARGRLIKDLSDQRARDQLIFGTEPLVDMMELSGYALLMQEVDGAGIWDDVRTFWDKLMSEPHEVPLHALLPAVLSARQGIFMLTTGGMERTGRRMRLDHLLRDRGVVSDQHGLPFMDDEPELGHPSAIVEVFAPEDLGGFGDLEDLFLVEYVFKRPEAAGTKMPRNADLLRESIELARERRARAAGNTRDDPHSPANPEGTDDSPETGDKQ